MALFQGINIKEYSVCIATISYTQFCNYTTEMYIKIEKKHIDESIRGLY